MIFAIFHSSGMTPELIDLLKSRVRSTDTDKMMGLRRVMGMLSGLHEVFEFQDKMISAISFAVHVRLLELCCAKSTVGIEEIGGTEWLKHLLKWVLRASAFSLLSEITLPSTIKSGMLLKDFDRDLMNFQVVQGSEY